MAGMSSFAASNAGPRKATAIQGCVGVSTGA